MHAVHYMILPCAFLVATSLLTQLATAQKFDPYQLNGGLVAAVAGKDFVLIASDTRLTDGGYGINSRRYLSGRIWLASPSIECATPTDSSMFPCSSPSLSKTLARKKVPAKWESDGSLVMPSGVDFDLPKIMHTGLARTANLPIMIGSAGCAADCESLKRRVRLEMDALEHSFPTRAMGVRSVANLLQQILYGRRGFPFYSFCVVAGIDQQDNRDGCCDPGVVYVYDAIGSYERVAVASAGTGRELLQPILDRLFSGPPKTTLDKQATDKHDVIIDSMAVPAGNQRVGVAGCLRPPVQTTVNCSWEEAVENIAQAYLSVAEREISVGDEIVICVVHAPKLKGDNTVCDMFRYPLKKH